MNIKKLLVAIFVPVAIFTSLMVMGGNEVPKNVAIQYQPPTLSLANNQVLNVYYFHGNVRCATCKRIEQYTTEGVQQGFIKFLGNGRMMFNTVNVEEAGNGHYINDFELITRSVVLELTENGQPVVWKRLDRVWELVTDEQQFINYLYREIGTMAPGA